MDYIELPVYKGPHTSCAMCLKMFRPGEVFTLANGGDRAFCYSDGNDGCLLGYLLYMKLPAQSLKSEHHVFRLHLGMPTVSHPPAPPVLPHARWWEFWK